MNLQSGLKLLLAAAVVSCGVAATADAQSVVTEVVGTVQSFHGGWTGNSSEIGQSVVFDFAYDASAVTTTDTATTETDSAPITFAKMVGGIFSGINLERDGSGAGKITDKIDFNSGIVTTGAETSTKAPSPGFSGDVYGFNLDFNGTSTSVDLTRDVYSHGRLDRDESGTVDLGNVVVAQVQAPEIDPASALSALTLLLGGLAVIRGRQSVKLQSA